MITDVLTQKQLRDYRKKMYPEYLKMLKKHEQGKVSKMEIYDDLAKKYYYKNAMVIFHTIRRIEGKNKPKQSL